MTDRKPMSWEEWQAWVERPTPRTIINQPIVELRLVVNNERKEPEKR
jgi:hypothetical protein